MKKAVIDSNVLLALIDKKDKWHSKASGVAEALRTTDGRLYIWTVY